MPDDASPPRRLRILFLCTGNSCRSQMAEGWARHLKGDLIEPYSAGVLAAGLSQTATEVMAEAGIDISDQESQSIEELAGVELDWVITLCGHAHQTCPAFPGEARVVHVPFDDPPALAVDAADRGAKLAVYRRIRDEIREFIATLPEALDAAEAVSEPGT